MESNNDSVSETLVAVGRKFLSLTSDLEEKKTAVLGDARSSNQLSQLTSNDHTKTFKTNIEPEAIYGVQDRFTIDYFIETVSDFDYENITEVTNTSTTNNTKTEGTFIKSILETFKQSAVKLFQSNNKTLQEVGFDPKKDNHEDVILNWYLKELNKTGHGNIIIRRPDNITGLLRGKDLDSVLKDLIKKGMIKDNQSLKIDFKKDVKAFNTRNLINEKTSKDHLINGKLTTIQPILPNKFPLSQAQEKNADLADHMSMNHSFVYEEFKKWIYAKKDRNHANGFRQNSPNRGGNGVKWDQTPPDLEELAALFGQATTTKYKQDSHNPGQNPPDHRQGPPDYRQITAHLVQTTPGYGIQNNGDNSPNYRQNPSNYRQGPPNYGQVPPNYGQGPPNYGQVPPNYGQGPPNYGQGPPNYGQGPPNYGQGPPNYGQRPPNYGQRPPNYGQRPPNYAQGPNNYEGGPDYGQGSPDYGMVAPNNAVAGPDGKHHEVQGQDYGERASYYGQDNPNYAQAYQNVGPPYKMKRPLRPNMGQISPNYGQIPQNIPKFGQRPQNYGMVNSNHNKHIQNYIAPQNAQGFSNYRPGPQITGEINGQISPLYDQVSQNVGIVNLNYGQNAPNYITTQNSQIFSNLRPGAQNAGIVVPNHVQDTLNVKQDAVHYLQGVGAGNNLHHQVYNQVTQNPAVLNVGYKSNNGHGIPNIQNPQTSAQGYQIEGQDINKDKQASPNVGLILENVGLTTNIVQVGNTSFSQIIENSLAEQKVTPVTLPPTPPVTSPFIAGLLKKMNETNVGYYTIFVITVLEIIANSKNTMEMREFLFSAETVLDKMMMQADFHRYGEPFNTNILNLARAINSEPHDIIKSLAGIGYNYMVNLKKVGASDIISIFSFLDDNIQEDEGKTLLGALEQFKLYPKTSKKAQEVMTDLLTANFAPTKRLTMTNEGRVLFGLINKAIAGRTRGRIYPRAGRDLNTNIYITNITLTRRYKERKVDIEIDKEYTLEKPPHSKIFKEILKKEIKLIITKHPNVYKKNFKIIKNQFEKTITNEKINKRIKKYGMPRNGYNYERHLNTVIRKKIAPNDIYKSKEMSRTLKNQTRFNVFHKNNKRKEFFKDFRDIKHKGNRIIKDSFDINSSVDTEPEKYKNLNKKKRDYERDKNISDDFLEETKEFNISKDFTASRITNAEEISIAKVFRNFDSEDKKRDYDISLYDTQEETKETEESKTFRNRGRDMNLTKDYHYKIKKIKDTKKPKINSKTFLNYTITNSLYDTDNETKETTEKAKIFRNKERYMNPTKYFHYKIKKIEATKKPKIHSKTTYLNLIIKSITKPTKNEHLKSEKLNLTKEPKNLSRKPHVIEEFIKRFARRKNDESVLKVKQEPNYSDVERKLKINLKDALYHGHKKFEHLRRNENVKDEKLDDDVEIILRKNIYKSFGFSFDN